MKISRNAPLIALLTLIFLVSAPLGLATYTFYYAAGYSYFSNKPEACINCHVMRDQYTAWTKGSHHAVANCNDCHAPKNFVAKYINKASNGFWHSWAFTTGNFKEPIEIKEHNRQIALNSCLNCHREMIETSHFSQTDLSTKSCLHCHQSVGHNFRK